MTAKPNTSDLIKAGQASHSSSGANPVGDFISMLSKYAQPAINVASTVGNDVMGGINAVGKSIGDRPLLPQSPVVSALNGGKPMGPTNAQAVDSFNGTNTDNPIGIPGVNLLHGQETPMGLLAIGSMTMGGADKPEDIVNKPEDVVGKAEKATKTEGLPPIGKAAEPVAEKPSMITKQKADPQTLARMQLNFDVPRRIAQNMQVKPDTVMNQLIEDGVTGRNLDDLQNIANSVTGEKGAFPAINNHILSSIKTPIDYGDAITSRDVNLQSVLEGEKPGFINQINKEVMQAMKPLNYNKPGELPSSLPAGQAYAPDLFQTSQNLRDLQRMYMRQANTDMGELNHPEILRASQAIGEIKNNIDDAIDKAVSPEVYQSFKNDPFVQQQLSRVPTNVAQRWMQGADRFKDGQKIQAPYVNLSHMIEDTKDTQLSVWTKAAKAMQSQNVSGGVGGAVKDNMPGPKILKNAVGGIAELATKPFDKTPEDIFEENMNPAGKVGGGKIPGGKLTKAIVIGAGLTAAGAGLEHLNESSKAQSQNGTNESDNGHNASLGSTPLSVNSQIETDMSKIDPSTPAVDPRQATGSDGTSIAMSDGQHQTAMAALDALVKQDPSYITNPIKAGQLAAAKDAIQKKYDDSQKLMTSFQKVATVQQKVQDAQNLLQKTSPALTDKIGFLEGGHEMLDPKYQALVNDLNFIEKSDPRLKGQLSNLATKESVKTALESTVKLLLSEHNQLLKSYGVGSDSTTSTAKPVATPPSQIPAGLPAPVNGALPQMQNGSYQFTAPDPLFQ
jgi:hypothetical protein